MIRVSIFTGALLTTTVPGFAADLDEILYGSRPIAYAEPGRSALNQAIQGYLEGRYTRTSIDDVDADIDSWSLRGALNVHAGEGVNFQVDGGYARSTLDPVDVDLLSGAFHTYYRPGQQYAVGAFVQGGQISTGFFDDIGLTGIDANATDYVVGGEAAYLTDRATFHGKAGFGQASWSGFDADHFLGSIGTRLYATDNLRFDAEGTLNRLEADEATADVYSLTLTGNYRPDGLPFSTFAGYRFDHTELKYADASLGDAQTHSVFAGLRLHFGSASLKEEERNGPMWSTPGLLP